MELVKRKRNRLEHYDYSTNGMYFVTICVANKEPLLWNPVGANCVRPNQLPLTDIGNCIENEIQKLNTVYETLTLDKYVIMPNHIHMILVLQNDTGGRTQFAPTISRVIKQFKGSITKQIGRSIWQKSFYEHVIRNEKSYQDIWNYIDTNPFKWADDCYYQTKID